MNNAIANALAAALLTFLVGGIILLGVQAADQEADMLRAKVQRLALVMDK